MARRPDIALVALVHRLSVVLLLKGYRSEPASIGIGATTQDGLDVFAPDVVDSSALTALHSLRAAWVGRLPQNPDALFAALRELTQDDLLSLLALCVSLTVSAVTSHESSPPAVALAKAVALDMHDWWTPSAAGYFAHVSKAKVLEAVQVFAPEQVERLAKLKKAELVIEAERLVVGTGWMPVMFREVGESKVDGIKAVVKMSVDDEVLADDQKDEKVAIEVEAGEHAVA